MITQRAKRTSSRAGLVLIAVLAILFLVLLFGAAVTQSLLIQRRNSRLLERQQQAFWLAESALQRARESLNSDEYRGETWDVPENVLEGGGSVAIQVERIDELEGAWRIRVAARFPGNPVDQILQRREVTLNVDET